MYIKKNGARKPLTESAYASTYVRDARTHLETGFSLTDKETGATFQVVFTQIEWEHLREKIDNGIKHWEGARN